MNKLTKTQMEKHANLSVELVSAKETLETALDTFKTACEQKWSDLVIGPQNEYNQAMRAADAFRDLVHAQLVDYATEKSDKWRESEAGEAFVTWEDAWDASMANSNYEELDLDMPDFEVTFDADDVDTFESLPTTVEDA